MIANTKILIFNIKFRRLTTQTDFANNKKGTNKLKKNYLKNSPYPRQYGYPKLSLTLINKIEINMQERLRFEDKRNIVIPE